VALTFYYKYFFRCSTVHRAVECFRLPVHKDFFTTASAFKSVNMVNVVFTLRGTVRLAVEHFSLPVHKYSLTTASA
jgi:hypothetical protein